MKWLRNFLRKWTGHRVQLVVDVFGTLGDSVENVKTFRVSPDNTAEMQGKVWTRTQDERLVLNGTCPNCGSSEWLGGPSAPGAQNIECNVCHVRFNDMGGMGDSFIGYGPEHIPAAIRLRYKGQPESVVRAAAKLARAAGEGVGHA